MREDEREERSRDTWWWNKNVKEAIPRKKDAHKEISRTEANKTRYKNMKNGSKKVVMKAMKEATERKLRELSQHPNKVFKLVKSMEKDGKDVEGRGSEARLNFSKKDRGRVWNCLLYTSPSPRDA